MGLELSGFDPIFVNELNADALETYLVNRDLDHPLLRSKYHISDVKNLTANNGKRLKRLIADIKTDYQIDIQKNELDLLVGGPPCQGFSGMGHRRSYAVNKNEIPSNHLYKDMAYVVSKMKPKIFLFENGHLFFKLRFISKRQFSIARKIGQHLFFFSIFIKVLIIQIHRLCIRCF